MATAITIMATRRFITVPRYTADTVGGAIIDSCGWLGENAPSHYRRTNGEADISAISALYRRRDFCNMARPRWLHDHACLEG
jgi:hypothetical protein